MTDDLVLINNGEQNFIGRVDNGKKCATGCYLEEAFSVIEMAVPTADGPVRMQGIVPVIPNYNKAIKLFTKINSCIEITKDMELYNTYDKIHANCNGIYLASADELSNLKI